MSTLLPIDDTPAVFPLFARYTSEDGTSNVFQQVGTCFAVDKTGTMLTADHVLKKCPKTYKLPAVSIDKNYLLDGFYVPSSDRTIMFRVANIWNAGEDIACLEVHLIDLNGNKIQIETPFTISSETAPRLLLTDVWWFGFPLLANNIYKVLGGATQIVHTDVLITAYAGKGHIVMYAPEASRFLPKELIPCFLIDKPVIPGMSGAPLVLVGTRTVIGVLVNNATWDVLNYRSNGFGHDTVSVVHGLAIDICGIWVG